MRYDDRITTAESNWDELSDLRRQEQAIAEMEMMEVSSEELEILADDAAPADDSSEEWLKKGLWEENDHFWPAEYID